MNIRLSAVGEDGYPANDKWGGFEWIGNPRCEDKNEAEALLIYRRSDLTVIASVDDPNADYSYDEAAVVLLDGEYFLVQTSGCSCPSPSETWGVVVRGTLQDIRGAIERGEYGGYTLPPDKLAAFLTQIDEGNHDSE